MPAQQPQKKRTLPPPRPPKKPYCQRCGQWVFTRVLFLVIVIVSGNWLTRAYGPERAIADDTYDLATLTGPKVQGPAFNVLATLFEVFPTKQILTRFFYRQNGLHTVNQFADARSLAPTFYPLVLPTEEQKTESAKYSLNKALNFNAKRDCDSKTGRSKHNAVPNSLYNSVTDYACQYSQGKATPTGVLKNVINAIKDSDKQNPPLKIVNELAAEDELLKAAKASEARWKSGTALSVFDGVPVAVKDETDVAGMYTHFGTPHMGMARGVVAEDATIVARLRGLGALIVAHTNMHQTGTGTTGINPSPLHGTCRNPHNSSLITGGSSSGSAAIVAAGIVPLALGADGGGSIRIPATFCGTVGLKATWSRIPETGLVPACPSVGHAGPMTAHAYDAALSYLAIAGPDPLDHHSQHQPVPFILPEDASLKDVKIGIFDAWNDAADATVRTACQSAIQKLLSTEGMKAHKIVLPRLGILQRAHGITILSEMWNNAKPFFQSFYDSSQFGADIRVLMSIASSLTSGDYLSAQKVRTFALDAIEEVFEKVDVIITPGTPLVAAPIPEGSELYGLSDVELTSKIMLYVIPGNMLGVPGISVPVGFDKATGAPIGLQIMAKHWNEAVLLRVAAALEAIIPEKDRLHKPQHLYNPLKRTK